MYKFMNLKKVRMTAAAGALALFMASVPCPAAEEAQTEEEITEEAVTEAATEEAAVEEAVNGVIHAGKLGELVGKAAAQVFLPGDGRFLRGRCRLWKLLPAHEKSSRQEKGGRCNDEFPVPHLMRPARRPKSMIYSAVPSMPSTELSTHR